jgi:hypothetical protein
MIAELDNTPLYLMGDIGIVWGPPTDVCRGIAWKTCTRVRWAQLDSLIVIVNCGHSWRLCGLRVSCCQVRLIRISVTPSDMGDACSLLSFHYVHMRFTVMFNYNYLIVENDDTKNG